MSDTNPYKTPTHSGFAVIDRRDEIIPYWREFLIGGVMGALLLLSLVVWPLAIIALLCLEIYDLRFSDSKVTIGRIACWLAAVFIWATMGSLLWILATDPAIGFLRPWLLPKWQAG